MKTRIVLVVAILFTFLLGFGTSEGFADCGGCEAAKKDMCAVTTASPVTTKGTVICLGCNLKKKQDAKAQCSVYGHKNAIKAEDGKIWTILENDASKDLINSHDYAGKKVELVGKVFSGTQVLEIENFKIIEE